MYTSFLSQWQLINQALQVKYYHTQYNIITHAALSVRQVLCELAIMYRNLIVWYNNREMLQIAVFLRILRHIFFPIFFQDFFRKQLCFLRNVRHCFSGLFRALCIASAIISICNSPNWLMFNELLTLLIILHCVCILPIDLCIYTVHKL